MNAAARELTRSVVAEAGATVRAASPKRLLRLLTEAGHFSVLVESASCARLLMFNDEGGGSNIAVLPLGGLIFDAGEDRRIWVQDIMNYAMHWDVQAPTLTEDDDYDDYDEWFLTIPGAVAGARASLLENIEDSEGAVLEVVAELLEILEEGASA